MNGQQVVFIGAADYLWQDLRRGLEDEGLTCLHTASPPECLLLKHAAAVVIGPTVTESDRLALCREARRCSLASITVISEDLDEVDEMRLVVAGACVIAYLPIRPRVLAAQLANRIGRVQGKAPDKVLRYGRLHVDPIEHVASVDDHAVELTKTEFDLLVLLMENPRRVHTHEQISRWLWDDPWMVDHHRLEAHVCRLRKKVARAGGPTIIGSVRGVGYRLVAAADLTAAPHLAS